MRPADEDGRRADPRGEMGPQPQLLEPRGGRDLPPLRRRGRFALHPGRLCLASLEARVPRRSRGQGPGASAPRAFGGIAQLTRPRALVFVDRAPPALGDDGERAGTAPSSTAAGGERRCPRRSRRTSSSPTAATPAARAATPAPSPEGAPSEWGLAEWKRAHRRARRRGRLPRRARRRRERGPALARRARRPRARARHHPQPHDQRASTGSSALLAIADRFGQINVSLDGLGDHLRRGARLRRLRPRRRARSARCARAKREIGINVVVTRHNFDELERDLRLRAPSAGCPRSSCCASSPPAAARAPTPSSRCTDAQHRALLARRSSRRAPPPRARQGRLLVHADARAPPSPIARSSPSSPSTAAPAATSWSAPSPTARSPPAASRRRRRHRRARPRVDALAAYWIAAGCVRRVPPLARGARSPALAATYHALCRGGCKVVSRPRRRATRRARSRVPARRRSSRTTCVPSLS